MEGDKIILIPTPIVPLHEPIFEKQGVAVWLKRDDLTHPSIQGNKWRKLKHNLIHARANGYKRLLTFGGIYSNHIYATAAAGKVFGFETIGIIRGEALALPNATLRFASEQGMQLHYVDRALYKQYTNGEMPLLSNDWSDCYIIPEGGTNSLAIPGVMEMVAEITIPYHYLLTACGTGGTLAGIIAGSTEDKKIVGISVLKGEDRLTNQVCRLLSTYSDKVYSNWSIHKDYHCGGYARMTDELMAFIHSFQVRHDILLDPVYTSKMMYGLYDMIAKGYFARGSSIIAVHTGGLQGWCGYERNGVQ